MDFHDQDEWSTLVGEFMDEDVVDIAGRTILQDHGLTKVLLDVVVDGGDCEYLNSTEYP
jgi:hypothetical protein